MRVVPTEMELSVSTKEMWLPSRRDSKLHYRPLCGIFPGATVVRYQGENTTGKVTRIVHENGTDELTKAKYWKCVAEVDWKPDVTDRHKSLEFHEVGKKGNPRSQASLFLTQTSRFKGGEPGNKVEVYAKCPATPESGEIYTSHFPALGLDTLSQFVKLWDMQKTFRYKISDYPYVIFKDKEGHMILHINLTDLVALTGSEEFWNHPELLGNLKLIDFLQNRFEYLPDTVDYFSDSLEVVGLAFNCFTFIPAPVLRCTNVKLLNLYHNKVRTVDRNISSMRNLTLLELGDNEIRHLPDVFDGLPNLELLLAEGNFLSVLPSSVASLHNLKRLYLANNFFKEFPPPIVESKSLETLTLSNNRIQHIPLVAMPLLDILQNLTLEGNPLQEQIPELSLDTIRRHVQSKLTIPPNSRPVESTQLTLQASTTKPKTKALRILALGECGAGKTSLVQALCQKRYVSVQNNPAELHDHTVGIDRYKWSLQLEDRYFDIAVWDFAGEKAYSMMNQLFLTDNTLIWIVINLKRYKYEKSISPWLRSSLTFCEKSRIWIICTHSDLLSNDQIRVAIVDIKRQLRMDCDSLSVNDHNKKLKSLFLENVEIIKVTNTFSLVGHDLIKTAVSNLISSNCFQLYSTQLPESWASAEGVIMEHARKCVTTGEAPIKSHDEVCSLLQDVNHEESLAYLHQAGEILLFKHGISTESVLLDPSWLVFLLQCIFHHQFEANLSDEEYIERIVRSALISNVSLTKDDVLYMSENLNLTGKVTGKFLYNLWNQAGITSEQFYIVMAMLEKAGIAYCMTLSSSESPDQVVPIKDTSYLFPWLLEDQDDACSHCDVNGKNALVVTCSFTLYPFGLFERYIVQVLHLFNSQTVLMVEPGRISRHHLDAFSEDVQVHIHHYPNSSMGCCRILLHCIEQCNSQSDSPGSSSFWNIMSYLVKELKMLFSDLSYPPPSMYVLCPVGILRSSQNHRIPLEQEQLQKYFKKQPLVCLRCATDPSAKNKRLDLSTKALVTLFGSSYSKNSTYVFTEIFSTIPDSSQPMDDRKLSSIAYVIRDCWNKVGKLLLVDDYVLNAIDKEQQDERSKAHHMLQRWRSHLISSDPSLLSLITNIEGSACPEDQQIVHVCALILALSTE